MTVLLESDLGLTSPAIVAPRPIQAATATHIPEAGHIPVRTAPKKQDVMWRPAAGWPLNSTWPNSSFCTTNRSLISSWPSSEAPEACPRRLSVECQTSWAKLDCRENPCAAAGMSLASVIRACAQPAARKAASWSCCCSCSVIADLDEISLHSSIGSDPEDLR